MSRSSTTTRNRSGRRLIRNPHPGEILLEEFLAPLGLSQNALARAIKVPPRRINELVLRKRAVTADTDLRLARYFGLADGFFLGLQAQYDLMERRRKISAQLEKIEPRAA
jgi:addiction module HigA family antidote